MNKMLKGEIVDLPSKNKYNVSFFDDDSIETVRFKIAKAIDSHPDRLFILVGIKLPGDYYTQDPRRWEKLYERLSYNGEPIKQDIFSEYQLSYRSPSTSIPFYAYDKVEWMNKSEELRPLYESAEFIEYRIFGVEELSSFILPFSAMSPLVSKIASAKLPIPENSKLFSSLYSGFERFQVLEYNYNLENTAPVYFPLLRSNTPGKLTEETLRLIDKNSKLLKDLLDLKTPKPEEVTIIRTRFYVPWVDTDFGSAVRTRFEQIFYGLTVSKDTPYIGLFTSKDQVSRHKFFTEDSKQKKPYVDMTHWNAWWSIKPARNIPTLILFRGKSKHHFDRIAITAGDMVISTHRPEKNTESIDQLRRQVYDWLGTLDSVIPFVSENDIALERWELQDMAFVAKYSEKIEDFDLLRFNCISSVFDMSDKTKSQFSLLRTDHSNGGLSAIEVKVLQMIKDNATQQNVAEELSVSLQTAKDLLQQVRSRVEDDPRLAERAFRGYPTLKLGPDFVIVTSVSNLEKSLEYSNLLRFVLSNSKSDDLDKVCPKRSEAVSAESAVIPTVEVDAALEDEYADLFGHLEEEQESVTETVETNPEQSRISTTQKQGTTYRYFLDRLQKFDPDTFDTVNSKYPKKCNKNQQPIILNDTEIKKLSVTPYDIKKKPEEQLLELENPDGTAICPEYWCMKDQIPLDAGQLLKDDGEVRCPVCRGQLQTNTNDNPREFPLIKRDTNFVYPGFTDYKSPKNGRQMPCCFKRSKSKKNDNAFEDKYYVLGENKTADEERIAFLPMSIIESLHIKETYESFKDGKTRRLMSPNKGYFRVGLGRASKNLRKFLGIKPTTPSPRDSIETVLKCSFLHTWSKFGTTHLEEISQKLGSYDDLVRENLAKLISGIDEAYQNKELTTIQDLEYSALVLQCDVFRIHIESNTLGCLFYAPMVRPRSRGVIILQNEDEVDILGYTERKARGFEFLANIYEKPFEKETYVELEKLRNASCKSATPSYTDALNVMQQLLPLLEADDYSIILDPFGRGQAMYVPSKVIIPFQSLPLPDVIQSKINGYTDIVPPFYTEMKKWLEVASKLNPGYAFKEDLFNGTQKVEILLESGLRIPVKAEESDYNETGEVFETLGEIGESKLVFGPDSTELRETQTGISYSAEVYEFLLFQLTNDLIDNQELANSLRQVSPKTNEVKSLLEKWFNETVMFNDIGEPRKFLSKIRKPCDESCDGELCGWDGKVCKLQINSALNKDKLFHRLLTTLVDNSKIRSMVLDGRTTPFFSTILYLELPHELILTDNEL